MRRPGLIALLALLLVGGAGCRSGETAAKKAPPPVASVQPSRPVVPPTPVAPVTFASDDGAALSGDLYLAADRAAPSLVLVHRRYRDRSEWKSLVDTLRTADKRYTILAFDLRGEGASKLPPKENPEKAPDHMQADVRAAIAKVEDATGHATRGIVLAGSSLGAALIAQVAFDEPKVVALAMISPGMTIAGQDVLHPYADVRNLPTFIAAADDDFVAREPLKMLEKMAEAGTVKRYPGAAHGADSLAATAPLWSDLAAFLAKVHDEAPTERRPAYHKHDPKRRQEARR